MFRKRPEGRFFYAWPVVFRVIWRILVYMKSLLANKVARMSQSELLDAIYTDTLTGMWNRRAFEESPDSKYIAIVDVDSLKWVNDNLGHRAGDALLVTVATYLTEQGLEVYRLSGDEFVVRCIDFDWMVDRVRMAQIHLESISAGFGKDLEDADASLRGNKSWREEHGQRSPRGIRPPWMRVESSNELYSEFHSER